MPYTYLSGVDWLDCAKFKPKDDSNVHSDEVPLQTTVGKLQCFVKMQCSLLWIK